MKFRSTLAAGVAVAALTGVAHANVLAFPGASEARTYASELTGAVDGATYNLLLNPSSGTYLDTNQVITITFNGATIDGTSFKIKGIGTCKGNFAVSSGGGAGDDNVVVIADTLSGCDTKAANAIDIDVNLDIANGSTATVTASVVTEAGSSPVGGGTSKALELADWAAAFEFSAAADKNTPVATLPNFTSFAAAATKDVAGTITAKDTAGKQYALNGTTEIDIAALDPTITYTVTGNFDGIDNVNGTKSKNGKVEVTTGPNKASPANIELEFEVDGKVAITGGSYTVDATLNLGKGYTAPTANTTVTIDREGTDFVFTYTLDNTTVQAFPGTIVRYRITNNTDTKTGPVSLQLRSWDTTPTTSGVVTLDANGIPARGDLVFTPEQVQNLVGAYGVGDFIVTVEGDGDNSNLIGSYTQISNGGVTNFAVTEQ